MNLLDFLFFYWRALAPDGFYFNELLWLSAVISAVITFIRNWRTPPAMRIVLPIIWLVLTGLIWACAMVMVLAGPPLWLALYWADREYCRQHPERSVFRLRGAVRDHS